MNVAGVSVSPLGFLVILQSAFMSSDDDESKKKKTKMAFPISLTSIPPDSSFSINNSSKSNTTSNFTSSTTALLPSLFQENNDQTSVTSPEALTFLQLLNGVDMATPILPPDTLSLICVWYALLLEEMELNDGICDGENAEDISLCVEDELGLLSNENEGGDMDGEESNEFQEALDYIRAMIRTTLPSSSSGDSVSYMDASPWQRARVQLPRAWLNGVRIEEMNDIMSSVSFDKSDGVDEGIGKVPIQFILECSVDDGSKMLEIPLFSIPSSSIAKPQTDLQQQIDMSNEILQELSHNYNIETSAAFMSLSLYHRYNKSGEASADSPMLKVSTGLLKQLAGMETDDGGTKYCWVVSSDHDDGDDDIDTTIQNEGLPLYRPLASIQEEDSRVLQHLKEKSFGKDSSPSPSSAPSSNTNNTSYRSTPQGTESSAGIGNVKKSLTLEQQATQQKLKAAWKIAQQRQDEGAIEKIQKAMEELEKDVLNNPDNERIPGDDNPEEGEEPRIFAERLNELKQESALEKIQRAMYKSTDMPSSQQQQKFQEKDEEDVVGLISDLEEAAINSLDEVDTDDEEA